MKAQTGKMRAWPTDSSSEEAGAAAPPGAEVTAPPDAERVEIAYTPQGEAEKAAVAAAGLAASEQQMAKLASRDLTTGRDLPAGAQAETAVEKGKAEAAAATPAAAEENSSPSDDIADKDSESEVTANEEAAQDTGLWSSRSGSSGSQRIGTDAAVAAKTRSLDTKKKASGDVSLSASCEPSDSEERRKGTSPETTRPKQKRRSRDASSSRGKRKKGD